MLQSIPACFHLWGGYGLDLGAVCNKGSVKRFSPDEYVFCELTAREEAMYPCSSTSSWEISLLGLVEAMDPNKERGYEIHPSENER